MVEYLEADPDADGQERRSGHVDGVEPGTFLGKSFAFLDETFHRIVKGIVIGRHDGLFCPGVVEENRTLAVALTLRQDEVIIEVTAMDEADVKVAFFFKAHGRAGFAYAEGVEEGTQEAEEPAADEMDDRVDDEHVCLDGGNVQLQL